MRPRRPIVLSALPALLLAGCSSGGTGPEPRPTAAARKPTVLVAAHDDGRLVRVDLAARRPAIRTLVPDGDGTRVYPTEVLPDGDVVVTETTEGASEAIHTDVAIVDPETGERRPVTSDRRSVRVLFSPDGRHRYVLDSPDSGVVTSVYRTGPDGTGRETILAEEQDVTVTAAALSPDGRTLYVARTADERASQLLAIDTATGDRRTVRHGLPHEIVIEVAVSPDSRLLALSFADWEEHGTHVALVPAAGGPPRRLAGAGELRATAFSRDGGTVVLSVTQETSLGEDRYDYDYTLALADVATGRVEPIPGTDGLRVAVSLD